MYKVLVKIAGETKEIHLNSLTEEDAEIEGMWIASAEKDAYYIGVEECVSPLLIDEETV